MFCSLNSVFLPAREWLTLYNSIPTLIAAGAFNTIVNDSKIFRIGLIQGLTEGSLQTFVFLWSPALRTFARNAPAESFGFHTDGEPAYGLIFAAFMACGVLGGFTEPLFRKLIKKCTVAKMKTTVNENANADENENGKYCLDFLCTICYLVSALLFLTPVFTKKDGAHSFTMCFGAFLIYEFMVGLNMPALRGFDLFVDDNVTCDCKCCCGTWGSIHKLCSIHKCLCCFIGDGGGCCWSRMKNWQRCFVSLFAHNFHLALVMAARWRLLN